MQIFCKNYKLKLHQTNNNNKKIFKNKSKF